MHITLDRLREMVVYDTDSGQFFWKKRPPRSNIQPGSPCGNLDRYGYAQIHVDGKNIAAHRAAWAYHYGQIPNAEIDHINGKKSDNRICNLRLANAFQNAANKAKMQKNTSGHKGVTWHRCGKWQAQLSHAGKHYYLGIFKEKKDAAAAYAAKAKEIHGDFAHNEVSP